jgi:hypothetical protein
MAFLSADYFRRRIFCVYFVFKRVSRICFGALWHNVHVRSRYIRLMAAQPSASRHRISMLTAASRHIGIENKHGGGALRLRWRLYLARRSALSASHASVCMSLCCRYSA